MIAKVSVYCSLVFLLLMAVYDSAGSVQYVPAIKPVGTAAEITISTGDAYGGAVERHRATVTVLEVLRGEKAWTRIHKASPSNPQPPTDSEYVLASVRFEFEPGKLSGNNSYLLRESKFTAYSRDGRAYDPVSIVCPKPNFNGKVYSGESLTGWIAFLVARNDKKPTVSFNNALRFQPY